MEQTFTIPLSELMNRNMDIQTTYASNVEDLMDLLHDVRTENDDILIAIDSDVQELMEEISHRLETGDINHAIG